MKLPDSVKVGYRTYRIEPSTRDESDNNESAGLCSHYQGLIKSQCHGLKVDCANTLLHEILHCCMDAGQAGLDTETEERAVTAAANHLIGVMQSNPEVIRWIMRNARAEE